MCNKLTIKVVFTAKAKDLPQNTSTHVNNV